MDIKILFLASALTTTCSAAFASSNSSAAQVANSQIEGKDQVKVERVSQHGSKSSSAINVVKVPGAVTKYMLTAGGTEKKTVDVKIFDPEGNLILENQQVIDGTVGIVYTIKGSGVFTFAVTDKNGDSHLFME